MSLFRRASTLHLLLPFARTRSSLTLTHALADADQKLPVDSASVSSYPDGDRESAGPKDEDADGEVEYRMYRRRWIGVIAIVRVPSSLPVLDARGSRVERRSS